MIERIIGLDQLLFHLANAVWVSPVLDFLMPPLSVAGNLGAIWLVLLAALAALGGGPGRKMALAGLAGLVIGFAASELIKEITVRPRPFLSLPDARLLVSAPHSYAFPSGHATSAFAAASGAVLAAKKMLGRVPPWGWAMVALAAVISYSRLYVGVHYPTDVAAGALLGLACGWIGVRLATWRGERGRPSHPEKSEDTREEVVEVEYQLGGLRGEDETRDAHTAGGGRPLHRKLLQARARASRLPCPVRLRWPFGFRGGAGVQARADRPGHHAAEAGRGWGPQEAARGG